VELDRKIAALLEARRLEVPMASLAEPAAEVPVTDVFSHIEIADGRIWLLRDGIDRFAGDLTDELFTQKVEAVA
jgi:hypothetical protein